MCCGLYFTPELLQAFLRQANQLLIGHNRYLVTVVFTYKNMWLIKVNITDLRRKCQTYFCHCWSQVARFYICWH